MPGAGGKRTRKSRRGEAIELLTDSMLRANFCGQTGAWCLGNPTGLKACAVPPCAYSFCTGYAKCCNYCPCVCCRNCLNGRYLII